MQPPAYRDYDRLRELFRRAEARLKLAEQRDGEVVFPAINQLRYVGYHILESMALEGAERASHITKAESHAARAGYDILEAGILDCLDEYEQFKADFRLVTVTDVIPDYLDICQTVEKVRKTLSQLEDRDRSEIYVQLEPQLEVLLEINERLNIAREELKKKLRSRDIKIAYSVMGTLIAITGIVVGAILAS